MTEEERAYNYASTRKASKFQVGEIAKFYNDGYYQAEKDLELTWEDMALVCKIEFLICTEYKGRKLPQRELFYQEILKRFREIKKK